MRSSLRRSVGRLQVRQFLFWMSAALIGGAVPELLLLGGSGYLWVVWAAAIGTSVGLWWKDHRRDGIAVLVSLPAALGTDDTYKMLPQIDRWMASKHRGWFRAGPEDPLVRVNARSRAAWAITTIRHRLLELDPRSSDESVVFMYLHCRQEESFHLGRQSADVWRAERFQLPNGDGSSTRSVQLSLIVRYISTYANQQEGDYYEIDMSQTQTADIDEGLAEPVDLSSNYGAPSVAPRRLALAIYASDEKGSLEQFKSNVRSAATGDTGHGYIVDKDGDLCDRVLFISIPPAALISSLRSGGAQKFVRYIEKEWRSFAESAYGSVDVDVRVYVKGPSLIAFAAGAILPKTSKLVPWGRPSDGVTESTPSHDDDRYLAIIDGDDVGSEMERHLLNGNLTEAIEYSSDVSDQVNAIVTTLGSLRGVEVLSYAGDSAIFSVEANELSTFQDRIAALRHAKNLRFSCGIGRDAGSAYVSLRLAKTSGKNTSRIA